MVKKKGKSAKKKRPAGARAKIYAVKPEVKPHRMEMRWSWKR